MPMSKKVFRLKCKTQILLALTLELMDEAESLVNAIERTVDQDSMVIYRAHCLSEMLDGLGQAREELRRL